MAASTGVVSSDPDLPKENLPLVGLKIDVNPELLQPSDASIDSKIFTLIPSHIQTVREFKNHLSTNVLRTTSPFYFYNGDFRIQDEEDVRIFSLLREPCRILPVPTPRSALSPLLMPTSSQATSSTPITSCMGVSLSNTKQVKFNNKLPSSGLIRITQASAVNGCESESADEISPLQVEVDVGDVDTSLNCSGCGTFSSLTAFSPAILPSKKSKREGRKAKELDIEDTPKEPSKRKRRRRHKSKKNKVDPHETVNSFKTEMKSPAKNPPGNSDDTDHSSPNSKKRRIQASQAYDADESELDPSQNGNINTRSYKIECMDTVDTSDFPNSNVTEIKSESYPKKNKDKKVFLSPNTAFAQSGYVRPRTSFGNENGTISSFSSSEYGTPKATSTQKRRQDTPNLPRVLKNPCSAYDMVKRSLNARLNLAAEHSVDVAESNEEEEASAVSTPIELNGEESHSPEKNEEFYENLLAIKDVIDIAIGNTIAFKVIELNANYEPAVSSYKEACVTAKEGTLLTLEYKKNHIVERSGVFEIKNEDLESESLDEGSQKNFGELINPKLLPVIENSTVLSD